MKKLPFPSARHADHRIVFRAFSQNLRDALGEASPPPESHTRKRSGRVTRPQIRLALQ